MTNKRFMGILSALIGGLMAISFVGALETSDQRASELTPVTLADIKATQSPNLKGAQAAPLPTEASITLTFEQAAQKFAEVKPNNRGEVGGYWDMIMRVMPGKEAVLLLPEREARAKRKLPFLSLHIWSTPSDEKADKLGLTYPDGIPSYPSQEEAFLEEQGNPTYQMRDCRKLDSTHLICATYDRPNNMLDYTIKYLKGDLKVLSYEVYVNNPCPLGSPECPL